MRNVSFAVCSHAALTWIQLRQRETIRNGKMERAILILKIHQPSDSLASHALGRSFLQEVQHPGYMLWTFSSARFSCRAI
jgi:hypothetical protein